MNKILTIISFLIISSCAYNSGVVALGNDNFLVTKQAATGFTGMGNLKARAIGEANNFCASKKKVANIISTKDAEPPYILANYPRTEITFSCEDN